MWTWAWTHRWWDALTRRWVFLQSYQKKFITLVKREMRNPDDRHTDRVKSWFGDSVNDLDGTLLIALSLMTYNMDDIPWSFKDPLKQKRQSTFTEMEMAEYLVKIIPEHLSRLVGEIQKKKPKTRQVFLTTLESSIRIIYDMVHKPRPRTPSNRKPVQQEDREDPEDHEEEEEEEEEDQEDGDDEDEEEDQQESDGEETIDDVDEETDIPESSKGKRPRENGVSSPSKKSPKKQGPLVVESKVLDLSTIHRDSGINLRMGTEYVFMNKSSGTYSSVQDMIDLYSKYLTVFGNVDGLEALKSNGFIICDEKKCPLHKKSLPVKMSQLVEYLDSKKKYMELSQSTIHIDL